MKAMTSKNIGQFGDRSFGRDQHQAKFISEIFLNTYIFITCWIEICVGYLLLQAKQEPRSHILVKANVQNQFRVELHRTQIKKTIMTAFSNVCSIVHQTTMHGKWLAWYERRATIIPVPALSSRSGNFLLDPNHEACSFLMPREQFTGTLLSRGHIHSASFISLSKILSWRHGFLGRKKQFGAYWAVTSNKTHVVKD